MFMLRDLRMRKVSGAWCWARGDLLQEENHFLLYLKETAMVADLGRE